MILVALFCAANIFATTYKTTRFYYCKKTVYGWSKWVTKESNIRVSFNNSLLIIYSPVIQTYQIYASGTPYIDSDGDRRLLCDFIDQDGDRGRIEFIYRVNTNTAQIYIRFGNVQWGYDLISY